jgi:type I restriction enzyme S subunit
MTEWREVTLGDLGEVNRGRSRHRPRNAPHLYGGSYPFIQTGDIKSSNGRITSHSQTYSEAGLAQSRIWPKGTMVVTIAANIAETSILTYPACFPDSVVGFIADPSKANVRFIEYLFRYHKKQIQHENVGTGSVQDNINLQTLERLKLRVPSLCIQNEIVSTLGALDDKIDLNRRMNETLEAMARALFRDWFVDFGPTKAKMEGRPPYLAPEIWNLFPDRLDDDGKPDGWNWGTLADLAKTNAESWTNKKHPAFVDYVDLSNTKWGTIESVSRLQWNDAPSRARRIAKAGDTIIGTTRPGNGSFAYVSRDGLTISTGFAVLSPKKPIFRDIVYIAASSEANIERLANLADGHGGAYPAVKPSEVSDTELVIADNKVIESFYDLASSIRKKIEAAKEESQSLAKTRDFLLPKLMSGEIRVGDAEKIVEEVA